jgi:hypothetical protein
VIFWIAVLFLLFWLVGIPLGVVLAVWNEPPRKYYNDFQSFHEDPQRLM